MGTPSRKDPHAHPRLVHELPHDPVASELVANAVRHGRLPGHEVWPRVAVDEEKESVLTIDVSEPVLEFPVVKQDPGGESGRGLLVVSGVSESLDRFPRDDVGKTVRARLATN
ncbi:ATP-binding protein [Streptomyces sp. NPDC002276]